VRALVSGRNAGRNSGTFDAGQVLGFNGTPGQAIDWQFAFGGARGEVTAYVPGSGDKNGCTRDRDARSLSR
jgi:hypothetical protein